MSSFSVGIVAMIKSRERSTANPVAVAATAVVVFFLIGEFTVPH